MGRVLGKRIAIFRVIGSRKALVGLATSCDVDLQTDMVEMASLSQFRSYKAGRSGGTISISRLFSSSDSFSFMALQLAKTPISYVVELDDMTISGEAYISGQQANSPSQGYASHSITLTCTGDINVDAGYIAFADAEVARMCIENYGDGVGLTLGAAADVKELINFSYKLIDSFSELQYFTGITMIPRQTFYGCTSLVSIVIPVNVKVIGYNAFYATGIKTISTEAETIDHRVFENCKSLTTAYMPRVTSMGHYNFMNCTSLSNVSLGDITSIGVKCFFGCTSLRTFSIPQSVSTISEEAFYGSGLDSITIPSGVEHIGAKAFGMCQNMTYVKMLSAVPPILAHENAFEGTSTSLIIYVPKGSLNTYKSATNWNIYATKMKEYAD